MPEDKPNIDPYALSPYVTWAWQRNRDPILHAFKTFLPTSGDVLEFASGSGAHIAYFAPHFPGIRFQPSDCDTAMFGAIRVNRSGAGNVADPLEIDLTKPETWPDGKDRLYDAVFAINVLHVAPVAGVDGLAEIAARVLKPQGILAIYGPFKVDGTYTTPSNEAFDEKLLSTGNFEWGLKDVRDLERAANRRGIVLNRQFDMPAANLLLVFGRQTVTAP